MKQLNIATRGALILFFFVIVVVVAGYLATNDAITALVADFGSLGIFLVSVIAGFNFLVPVPAPALVPIFVEAGFPLWHIIFVMMLGTTFADLTGFYIGKLGKHHLDQKKTKPSWYKKLTSFATRHRYLVLPFVFAYSAFMPLPNELIMAPLGLAGFRIRHLIIPLLLGTFVHITILAYGANSIFALFYS